MIPADKLSVAELHEWPICASFQVNVYWPMFPPISLVDAHQISEYIGNAA